MRTGSDRPRHDDARQDRARGAVGTPRRGALLRNPGDHAHGSRTGAGSRGGSHSGRQPLFAEALQSARAGIDRRGAAWGRLVTGTRLPVARLVVVFVLLSAVPLA